MKNENRMREEIPALSQAPHSQLPDYSADPIVQSGVGRVLAVASARVPVLPLGPGWDRFF